MTSTIWQLDNPDSIVYALFHLGIAIGIGVLIGLERQLAGRETKNSIGGIRTFALVAIFGFLTGELGSSLSFWIPAAAFFGFSIFLSVNHFLQVQGGRRGITTEISFFLTFLLGLLVYVDQLVFAVIIALVISFLLSIKPKIEHVVQQVTEDELFAIFKFLVVSVLILPLLPNTTLDPFQVINPREIWTVVVLVLSLSFIGYVLIKFWGAAKGIILAGFIGGFVSSTMVTWVFSGKSRGDESHARVYGIATMLAVSIMFARIGILAEIVNSDIGSRILLPLLLFLGTGLLVVYAIKRIYKLGSRTDSAPVSLGNPFNLSDAIKFAGIYAAIIFLVALANSHFGNTGVFIVSAISGIASVDAIVISMSRLGGNQISMETALTSILIAAHSNNLVKLVISLVRGTPQFKAVVSIGISFIFLSLGFWAWFIGW